MTWTGDRSQRGYMRLGLWVIQLMTWTGDRSQRGYMRLGNSKK